MKKGTILLVEDDPNDVFFFEHHMRQRGIVNPLQVANDGQEALDYLGGAGSFADREKYPLPSLTILDWKLPLVMGCEVLTKIRATPELRKLIVVVLTSSISSGDIAEAYELGANAYLAKPADTAQLGEIIQAIKHFWLTLNHPPPTPLQKDPILEERLSGGHPADNATEWTT